MIIKKLGLLFMLFLLFAGCSLFTAPDNGKGQMRYFIADSTGTERYSFHGNEPIFVHFEITNPTDHDILYKKYPYMNDRELFSYGIYTPGTDGDDMIGYPPQLLQDTSLPKHETREQVYKIDGLEANEYRVKLQLLIFVNPNDFEGDCKPYLLLKVEE